MDFEKTVLILKQVQEGYSSQNKTLSGILRIETENGFSTIFLSLINVASVWGGEYYLFIESQNNLLRFPLGKKPLSFNKTLENAVNVKSGISSGIFFVKDGIPVLVAFSKTENCQSDLTDLKKSVANYFYDQKTQDLSSYNDEAVATENYYDLDKDIEEKISKIQQSEQPVKPCENKENFSEIRPYYKEVQQELSDLFLKFPHEECLERAFPKSKWAKINYSGEKYYVAGIVEENGYPKYICYGVPAKYSSVAPKELKGYCSFIPLSVFELKGDGYFMMFQDAITGECIKKISSEN